MKISVAPLKLINAGDFISEVMGSDLT